MKCNFCGYQFEKQLALEGCAGCFFGKGCKLIRCPKCGYEWPADNSSEEIVPLTDLQTGLKKEIVSLGTSDEEYLNKLISLGILPGVKVMLLRRAPSILCRIGHTQMALDREIARFIYVRK